MTYKNIQIIQFSNVVQKRNATINYNKKHAILKLTKHFSVTYIFIKPLICEPERRNKVICLLPRQNAGVSTTAADFWES